MLIKRVQPVPLGKMFGLLNAVVGLLAGVVVSLVSLAFPAFGGMPQQSFPGMSLFFGVGAIVFLPIFYGLFGFLSGLIGAALYNVLAKVVGGVVIDVE
jgi:hypothetical protein